MPLAVITLLAAVMLQGFAGFGSGLLAIPLLLHAGASLPQALMMLYPACYVQVLLNLIPRRQEIAWPLVRQWVPWASAGIILGVSLATWLCTIAPAATIKSMVGVIICAAFIAQCLPRRQAANSVSRGFTAGAAMSSGFLSGSVGMGGPPMVMWLLAHGHSGKQMRVMIWCMVMFAVPFTLSTLVICNGPSLLAFALVGLAISPLIWICSGLAARFGDRIGTLWNRRIAWALLLIVAIQAITSPLLSAAENTGETTMNYSIIKKLSYRDSKPALTLDLYLPKDRNKPVACVMVIQGGGFRARDGQGFKPFAAYLAEHGYAAALIAYRGTPNNQYRDTISDIKESVRFIRSIAAKHQIDPKRIGAMGRSAGGSLVGLLATTNNSAELNAATDLPQFDCSIQAGAAFCGVYDFVARFTDEKQKAMQPRFDQKIETNGAWIGSAFAADNSDWLQASAINHVDKTSAPLLLLHCKDDSTVPWLQSQDMYEAYHKAGVTAEVRLFEKGGHGFGPSGETAKQAMLAFFNKQL